MLTKNVIAAEQFVIIVVEQYNPYQTEKVTESIRNRNTDESPKISPSILIHITDYTNKAYFIAVHNHTWLTLDWCIYL